MNQATVGDHMTLGAHLIASHETVARARTIMREHGVRHLPVVQNGKLVGVLSDRDLRSAEGLRPDDDAIVIADVMTEAPFTVAPDAPLGAVARTMAARRWGCAVIVDRNGILGVFTTTDALEALADTLQGKAGRRDTESMLPTRRRERARILEG